jgi:hypothetical protein
MDKLTFRTKFIAFFAECKRDIWATVWLMFKIMIPVSIVVKILRELGAIELIGQALAPLMKLVGLPGEMGLVWATGMITNLFGGVLAFLQMTVISVMMLVAHTFPIELQIARKAGVRLWVSFLLRFVFAFVLGALINLIYTTFGWFDSTAVVTWRPEIIADPSWADWAIGELKSYGIILAFIISLIVLVKLLRELGIIRLITKALGPVLRWMGIGENVTTITIIGLTLGIVYGGALIINESRNREINRRDIFYSLALMGLCHSVIEDTILVVSLGADIIGVLVIRLIFALAVTIAIVRLTKQMREETFLKVFMTKQKKKTDEVIS